MQGYLRKQILRRLILIFLAISFGFGILIYSFESKRYFLRLEVIETTLDALVKNKINNIGNMLFFHNTVGMKSTLEKLLDFHGVLGCEIYDSQGILFFQSPEDRKSDEVLDLYTRSEEESLIEKSRFDNIPALVYTTPIVVAGDLQGFAKFYYDLRELNNQVRYASYIFISLIVSLFASTVLLLYGLLRKNVTTPLSRLAEITQDVGQGELGKQLDLTNNNEIGIITDEFNKMSRENAEMYHKLADINASLERQVIIRTEELQKSQDLLTSVLDSSQDGIMVLKSIRKPDGKIEDFEWLMANPKASANFAAEVGEIIGKKLLVRFPSLKQEDLYRDFVYAAETGKPFTKEIYTDFEHLRGWYKISAMIISEELAVTFHDITVSKQLQLNLERQANSDGLTGIANRAYFDKVLTEQWALCAEEKLPLSLLFLDVDYFKKYNDFYGHGKGDECLKILAEILEDNAGRPLDCAARYGGEEFVMILPRTEVQGAESIARSLQEDLQKAAIEHKDSEVSSLVTVSIGIVSAIPKEDQDCGIIVKKADEALYDAKKQGRNRYKTLPL